MLFPIAAGGTYRKKWRTVDSSASFGGGRDFGRLQAGCDDDVLDPRDFLLALEKGDDVRGQSQQVGDDETVRRGAT